MMAAGRPRFTIGSPGRQWESPGGQWERNKPMYIGIGTIVIIVIIVLVILMLRRLCLQAGLTPICGVN